MAHAWIDAKRTTEFDERLLIIEEAVGIPTLDKSGPTVVGGLPTLPGTDVIMPAQTNGHVVGSTGTATPDYKPPLTDGPRTGDRE